MHLPFFNEKWILSLTLLTFIVVYIDDILIFSDNITHHLQHLSQFFAICEKEGLILSKNKMKIGVTRIEFLGLEVGQGKVQLQPHIVKKIIEFKENDLETLKGLQSLNCLFKQFLLFRIWNDGLVLNSKVWVDYVQLTGYLILSPMF